MKRLVDGQRIDATGGDELPHGATGIFETLLLRDATPLFWREHWIRFEAGCGWAGFAAPANEDLVRAVISDLARENLVSTGVARFAAWREASTAVRWCVDVTPPRPSMRRSEFAVQWGAPLPAATDDRAFKHLQRSAWLAALRAARIDGADEALLCDPDGRLVEGCVSNVFLVRNGQLSTPSPRSGPLPGVMRQQVIRFAQSQGWPVHETECRAADVAAATEVWLTNALIGLRPAMRIGEQILDPTRPFLDRFRTAWRQTHGYDPVFIA